MSPSDHSRDNVSLLSNHVSGPSELFLMQSIQLRTTSHQTGLANNQGYVRADHSVASSNTDANVATGEKTTQVSKMLEMFQHPTWLYLWSWEIGACLASCIGYFAIIGLLAAYDGKAQPDWPYGINLNSAVSFLATVTKGFTLVPLTASISQSMWISYSRKTQKLHNIDTYDAASRGPWGAFMLLCSLRIR